MSEENKTSPAKKALKILGILAIALLAIVAVAFGLLVGLCGLKR